MGVLTLVIYNVFWVILGLGIAIPSTLLILFNLFTKAIAGENYELKIDKLGIYYLVTIVGWAVAMGIRG